MYEADGGLCDRYLRSIKKQVLLLAIAVLFLMGVGVYAGIKIGLQYSSTSKKEAEYVTHEDAETIATDPYAVDINHAYLDSLYERADILDEQAQANDQVMKYHLFTDVWFTEGKTEQELPIWNDPLNKRSMWVQVWLQEDFASKQNEQTVTALITTGNIAPGQMLMKVSLSRPMEVGTYPAVFVYTLIDRAGTKCSSFEANTMIHVQ